MRRRWLAFASRSLSDRYDANRGRVEGRLPRAHGGSRPVCGASRLPGRMRHDLALAGRGPDRARRTGRPVYNIDPTTLKTMIRARTGLVLLKEGIVLGKWNCRDIPRFDSLYGDRTVLEAVSRTQCGERPGLAAGNAAGCAGVGIRRIYGAQKKAVTSVDSCIWLRRQTGMAPV